MNMLHTFFFGLSFLMDYHAVADALRDAFVLGLINASLVCVVVAWRSICGRLAAGNRGMSTRNLVEQPRSSKHYRTASNTQG